MISYYSCHLGCYSIHTTIFGSLVIPDITTYLLESEAMETASGFSVDILCSTLLTSNTMSALIPWLTWYSQHGVVDSGSHTLALRNENNSFLVDFFSHRKKKRMMEAVVEYLILAKSLPYKSPI